MQLIHLPLQPDNVTRVGCEGPVSLRGRAPASDPWRELRGPHCFNHRVLLSLEKAQGIDTSGVIWLMRAFDQFRRGTGRLMLCAVPPIVQQTLAVLGLDALLPI